MTLRGACAGASAAGIAWVLAGYPAVLRALPARPWRREDGHRAVSVLVCAYNERELLAEKLAALLAVDYPPESLEIVVAIDEDEETARLAREAAPGALVLFAPERGGKTAALNRAAAAAHGEIVILTDANNVLAPGSVRAAAQHFADPAIWAVGGRRGEAESAYDRYEDLLRRLESRSGSVAALSGEFIAVRRSKLPRFPEGVVNDDLWLLGQLLGAGGRVVYEPEAGSLEPALGARAEMARRSRMGAGRVMLLGELGTVPARFRWRLVSHKHGRLGLPFALAALLVSTLSLCSRRPYRVVAGTQVAVYAAGGLSAAGVRAPGPAGKLLRAAGQFTLGNVAVAVGVVRAFRGRQDVRWTPVR